MALVAILRPQTESELAIALAILEAHEIESFVHGQYFGSLLPGLQIESYNTRTIMVPEERADEAREALAESAPTNEPAGAQLSMRFRDKARVERHAGRSRCDAPEASRMGSEGDIERGGTEGMTIV